MEEIFYLFSIGLGLAIGGYFMFLIARGMIADSKKPRPPAKKARPTSKAPSQGNSGSSGPAEVFTTTLKVKDMLDGPEKSALGFGEQVQYYLGTAAGMTPEMQEVQDQFVEQIKSRGITNLSLYWVQLGSMIGGTKRFLVCEQEMSAKAFVRVAMRLGQVSAQDMQIEILHYERNWKLTGARGVARASSALIGGILLLVVGIMTAMIGVGLFAMPVGIGLIIYALMGGKKRQTVGFEAQQSQAFYDMVKISLEEAIDLVSLSASKIETAEIEAKKQGPINPEGQVECPEPSCGFLNPPAAKFCNECGTELQAALG